MQIAYLRRKLRADSNNGSAKYAGNVMRKNVPSPNTTPSTAAVDGRRALE